MLATFKVLNGDIFAQYADILINPVSLSGRFLLPTTKKFRERFKKNHKIYKARCKLFERGSIDLIDFLKPVADYDRVHERNVLIINLPVAESASHGVDMRVVKLSVHWLAEILDSYSQDTVIHIPQFVVDAQVWSEIRELFETNLARFAGTVCVFEN
jgi:hypothetical protein